MRSAIYQSLNDLATLFTARAIALPLIILLAFRIYTLSPETLVYTCGLIFLTALFAMRWSLYFIARRPAEFAAIYRKTKQHK